jgi:antitoxin PrlF
MPMLVVSSKGQIVLPVGLRNRLGLGAGARLEVLEEPHGLKLRVVRQLLTTEVEALAGMVRRLPRVLRAAWRTSTPRRF